MPRYDYECQCGRKFERLVPYSQADKQNCSCGKAAKRQIATGIMGSDGNAEPWHYEWTKKMKPKFVKDHKGNRQRYDPSKHTLGKGRGR